MTPCPSCRGTGRSRTRSRYTPVKCGCCAGKGNVPLFIETNYNRSIRRIMLRQLRLKARKATP